MALLPSPSLHLLYMALPTSTRACYILTTELQVRKAAAKSRLDSKVKGKATPQRGGSAGGRGKGKVEGKTAPTRTDATDEAVHGKPAETTASQPKRTKSATSVSDVAAGDGASTRPEHACNPKR